MGSKSPSPRTRPPRKADCALFPSPLFDDLSLNQHLTSRFDPTGPHRATELALFPSPSPRPQASPSLLPPPATTILMTSIDTIPPEVLSLALSFTANDRRDLLSAALVSRQWRDWAQRLLHRELWLRGPEQAEAWLASETRSYYTVRSLRFSILAIHRHLDRTAATALVRRVLQACGSVHDLVLRIEGDLDWGVFRVPSLSRK